MDAYEATKIVFSRIQSLDPINAAKIMGLLLIQDHGDKEMIRLAFGPESLLISVVLNARKDLTLLRPSSPSSVLFLGRKNSSLSSWTPPSPFDEETASGNELHDKFSFLNNSMGELFLSDEHRRNCSVSDLCLYFASGNCKNGNGCRFLYGDGKLDSMTENELLLRSCNNAMPFSPSAAFSKGVNFLHQHQPPKPKESPRAAAGLILRREEQHKFFSRPRMERCDFAGMVNPCSRQIYLTFPADSTFREEDVSIYFSIYGPVKDVRIPYQQKRMFGFVTFVYPETVKLILAKGNPHFVCNARVLVKPYKEKGKVLDKKQQSGDWADFSGCTTPTGLHSRDQFNLQQLGARTRYGSCRQDALLQRKIDEQQELNQAIELQHRRFMGLQLQDLTSRNRLPSSTAGSSCMSLPTPIKIAHPSTSSTTSTSTSGIGEDKSPILVSGSAASFSHAEQVEMICKSDGNTETGAEHNLPDNPFASPTKSSFAAGDSSSLAAETAMEAFPSSASSSSLPTSTSESMAPFKSCFSQIPWCSSDAGEVSL